MSVPSATHATPGVPLAADDAAVARRHDRRWPPAVALAIVVLLVLCAVLAPLLAPHSPVEGSLGERLAPPIGLEGAKPGHVLAPTVTGATP